MALAQPHSCAPVGLGWKDDESGVVHPKTACHQLENEAKPWKCQDNYLFSDKLIYVVAHCVANFEKKTCYKQNNRLVHMSTQWCFMRHSGHTSWRFGSSSASHPQQVRVHIEKQRIWIWTFEKMPGYPPKICLFDNFLELVTIVGEWCLNHSWP